MSWVILLVKWYIPILLLGFIAFPIARKIFKSFPDEGYAFSKIIAMVAVSYIAFVLAILRILPFNRIGLILISGIIATVSGILILGTSAPKPSRTKVKNHAIFLIIFEEILFFLSLLFWTYIRSQEPSIRSLEKFMDFGFINSILRSTYFPPLDIWYSADNIRPEGYPINYYYFGHLVAAVLIKITQIKSSIAYNFILATIFGLGVTQTFSLIIAIIYRHLDSIKEKTFHAFRLLKVMCIGILGSFMVNLGGNLHTVYLFTKGYPNEQPVPFWQILSTYNPAKYWYPNATRFIPFTIHEFPSYSYVVADLHGHVFDIPVVLLTLALLFVFFTRYYAQRHTRLSWRQELANLVQNNHLLLFFIFLGFLAAVHYMTNAFDGPIYILLSIIILFFLFKFSLSFFLSVFILISSFITFSLPFTRFFTPFVTGIGVNCSPNFLADIGKIGPFLFERGNCQISALWMLMILWGFFWVSFILFAISNISRQENRFLDTVNNHKLVSITNFILILFVFGTVLVIIPEFFYIKDIYPAHFRANTIFKMGYQAFIMMGIASAYTFFRIKLLSRIKAIALNFIFLLFFSFVAIYPLFSIPSYYGNLNKKAEIDGANWLEQEYAEDKEIIDYLNTNIRGQPVILEAQGDSYTDYERISAFTGLPTVAGWLVHEWLWRGSSNIISKRIPDVVALYESEDLKKTLLLIRKYRIKYIIVSRLEKQKYPNLNENKLKRLGKLVFISTNKLGAVYQVN